MATKLHKHSKTKTSFLLYPKDRVRERKEKGSLMFEKKDQKSWRDGVYLCTAKNSFEADLLASKLSSEGIPCVKKDKGAGNFLEIFMGSNTTCAIDIFVPEDTLEEAKNVIIAFPILNDEIPDEPVDFDSLTEEELTELIGEEETDEQED